MKSHQPVWITALLYYFGATYALNGIVALFAPSYWFFTLVPGVPETGPFNAHLVMDAGTFNIPIGIAMLVAARDAKRHVSAVAIAAGATLLHAFLHIYSHEAGLLSLDHIATELFGIYIPAIALIAITAALMFRTDTDAIAQAGLARQR